MTDENAIQALTRQVDPDNHYEETEYDGLTYMRTEFVDHRRWVVVYLDVYYHPATSTYAGVLRTVAATEMQEGSESEPSIVAVETDPTPHYRVKRTPKAGTK